MGDDSRLDLLEEVRALAESLDLAHVPYAICGDLALAVHGHPRATKDLDLLYFARACRPAQGDREGPRVCPRSAAHAVSLVRDHCPSLGPIVDEQLLTLDILVSDGVLDGVLASREEHYLGTLRLWVVSRAGLIAMKLAAGRPQDLADLARLAGDA